MTVLAKVTAVIPTHNRKRYLVECLRALRASTYRNLSVVVVDDGSNDGTRAAVNRLFPSVSVVEGDGNLWWAGAMNVGIKYALAHGASYVLVLNDDVLLHERAVEALVECATKNARAIVASLILVHGDEKTVWCAGGDFHWPWPGEVMLGSGQIKNDDFADIRPVEWAPGMGTLLPRSVFSDVGLYDARNMPQYLADADYIARAKKAGYRVLVTSESTLLNRSDSTGGIHASATSLTLTEILAVFTSPRSPDYLPARLRFIWRHCPPSLLPFALAIRYSRLLIFLGKRLIWTSK